MIIFYTFQPGFLTCDDLVGPGETSRGCVSGAKASDSYLSDRGRAQVFLYSLIPASIASILYFTFSIYFVRTSKLACKKGAKSLKECKLIK